MLRGVSGGGGGTAFTGSIAATQVAFGSGANAFAGSNNFTYTDSPPLLTVGSGTTTAAGVQVGYSGTSGMSGIWQTGVTATNANANILIAAPTSLILAPQAGGTVRIRPNTASSNFHGLQVDNTLGAIAPEADAGLSLGTSSLRFSSAFLGSGTAITASAPAIDAAQIWNNAAVTFNGQNFVVTNTASNVASTLFSYKVGAANMLSLNAVSSVPALTLGAATLRDEGAGQLSLNRQAYLTASSFALTNTSVTFNTSFGGAADTGLSRNAPGILEVNNGSAGTFAAMKLSTLTATAVAPTVAAGQIGYGSTTAATATAGSGGALPVTVQAYIIVNVAGTNFKIPYYAV